MCPWNIVSSKNGCCFDKQCQTMFTPYDLILETNTVNQIKMSTKGQFLPGFVVQIKHHLFDNPWRVMNEYIYPDSNHNLVIVPIISEVVHYLKSGDSLCHFQLTPIQEVLQKIKGKY